MYLRDYQRTNQNLESIKRADKHGKSLAIDLTVLNFEVEVVV